MLAARGLACRRGGRLVFEAVAFALEPGDALLLLGANGTGKTSLLRLLAGFARPAAGSLTWQGREIGQEPAEHAQRVHFLGFADGVEGLLSVRENLAYQAALLGAGPDRLDDALRAFDLVELADRPARKLSAGQRRRLALARLAAAPRPLWLLDEPGVALDRVNRARLEDAIERHREQGGVAVVATHGDVRVRDPLVLELGERGPC
ncbi:MAG: heme ABC exporter ATP-binding protein CcmA [Geminicoccaceae bacterium]|nr:heme ABC exporter ATP-binding protein CcmA [Geminicoccaceae bacterium]MCX8101330.1 heme ABC exporter ATP-binding protein CcmA [Geminicoccaceae bacterium]MDW8370978.1 heme ABC exporter ATP-binding protein CcmA [Geminicoccaceae bacterium]